MAVFGFLGTLADVDLLFGSHSTYTHSIGAVFLVGLIAALVPRVDRLRFGAAAAAAYGSHLILDWLGNDSTAPIGILALWPFSDRFYQSHVHLFLAISRRYWLSNFWVLNARAIAWEIALLAPLAAASCWITKGPRTEKGLESES